MQKGAANNKMAAKKLEADNLEKIGEEEEEEKMENEEQIEKEDEKEDQNEDDEPTMETMKMEA